MPVIYLYHIAYQNMYAQGTLISIFLYSLLKHNQLESSIADLGTTNNFLCPQDPVLHCQRSLRSVEVKVANGQHVICNIMTHLNLKNTSKETTLACIIPGFPDSLFSISNLCNLGIDCAFSPNNLYA